MIDLKTIFVFELCFLVVYGQPVDFGEKDSDVQTSYKECWRTLDGDHFNGKPFEDDGETLKTEAPTKWSKLSGTTDDRRKRNSKLSDHPALNSIGSLMNIVNSNLNLNVRSDPGVVCKACKTGIQMIKVFIALSKSNEDLIKLATGLCTELKIMTEEVCDGLVRTNVPAIIYILKKSKLSPMETCSFLVKTDCDNVSSKDHTWHVDLPKINVDGKMARRFSSENEVVLPDRPQLKVLHISDTHFDPHYKEGTSAECSLPLCCRNEVGEPDINGTVAGPWGGWKCDIPEKTLDNMLEHINKQHPDIDYVIWTGDVPPHDSWSLNKTENLQILNKTISKMMSHFSKIPVYPALGNHETVPPNLFPPENVAGDEWSVDWLYKRLENDWNPWLGNETSRTLRKGAFYALKIRPGLRMISLNMNFCYYNNWWLILNSTDPMDELKWLIEVLQDAEKQGDKVHIIGHIPAGSGDCLKIWQKNYYKIIERFSNTVRAQFFGHTHTDEFELFYGEKDLNNPVGIAYVGPSVTTYTYLNPGYRIYYIDGDHEETTRYVTNHETWIMDLERANDENSDSPTWRKMYSAKEAYNLTSLTPRDWHDFYKRLQKDDDLMDLYYRHYWKESPKRPPCDENWKIKLLCDIRSCDQYGPIDGTFELV